MEELVGGVTHSIGLLIVHSDSKYLNMSAISLFICTVSLSLGSVRPLYYTENKRRFPLLKC